MSVAGATEPPVEPAAVVPLPPRTPSALARYSRNFKLVAVAVGFAVLCILYVFSHRPMTAKDVDGAVGQAEIHGIDKVTEETKTAPVAARHTSGGNHATASNDQDDQNVRMAQAPDPALSEDTSQGSLPRIGEDGRQPWQVYARPFNTADTRPRVAIVVADLGQERMASDAAIARLPGAVTLAFDALSPVVGAWSARARQDGHETLLQIPMEPFDYPRSDPGAGALLTTLPNTDNIERLLALLRQGVGYVGITTLTGSRFTASPEKMSPVLEILKQRGLMIFDARVAPHSVVGDLAHDMHVPSASQTERIDLDLSPDAVDKALDQLEKDARVNGMAIGVTSAEPLVLEKLQAWLKDLSSRGVALAPVSAMVQ